MPPSEDPSDPQAPVTPRLTDLFTGFAGMSLLGFGGVLPWAYYIIIERRKWLTPAEFGEALAIAQFLPGGNILNLAVAIGQRFHGAAGALACVVGLLAGPFVLVTLLAGLFLRYGQVPVVHDMLGGIAAAAAGLMLALAAKMARPLVERAEVIRAGFAVTAFVGVGVAQLSLVGVIVVLAPLSVAYAWWRQP